MKVAFNRVLILILFIFPKLSRSQVSTYLFQSDINTYTELSSGTVLGDSTSEDEYFTDATLPLGGSSQSGPGISRGFPFLYNGFNYDVFVVSVNGWIGLGNGSVNLNSVSNYFPLNSSTGSNFIAAFARNLQAQGNSSIQYSILGTSPNQVLVIQWKNYRKQYIR